MWAVVTTVEITDVDKAVAALDGQVVPMMKGMDGFVRGTWVRHDDATGTSIVVFETEAQAKAALPPQGVDGPEGVRFTSVRVAEVAALA